MNGSQVKSTLINLRERKFGFLNSAKLDSAIEKVDTGGEAKRHALEAKKALLRAQIESGNPD